MDKKKLLIGIVLIYFIIMVAILVGQMVVEENREHPKSIGVSADQIDEYCEGDTFAEHHYKLLVYENSTVSNMSSRMRFEVYVNNQDGFLEKTPTKGKGYITDGEDIIRPYKFTKVRVKLYLDNELVCDEILEGDDIMDLTKENPGPYHSESQKNFAAGVLVDYDSDDDNMLSKSEWNAWCRDEGYDSMSNCDKDGDGYCSYDELAEYSKNYGY